MKKLKVMTIIGTRPEIIRLSECIKALDRSFDHVLVHTGQNYDYELNKIFFEDLDLREPDHYMNVAGNHLGETMGNVVAYSYELMSEQKPGALLILGDTNSALCAISAKRLKIPIFHMEAGNRCFDQNVPEEINRKIVDHISDLNMPYTEHGRRNLIAEGIPPEFIFTTGSPMPEILAKHKERIAASNILEKLSLKERGYFVVSAHREENIDDEKNFLSLMTGLNHIAERYQLPIIYSIHPRSLKKVQERGFTFHPLVSTIKPLGFLDYNKLQMHSFCVLSDSGTLAEDSAILAFPSVSLRTSTERQEALDKGIMVLGGITGDSIETAVEIAVRWTDRAKVPDYSDMNVSGKVERLIASYVDIIKKRVWGR